MTYNMLDALRIAAEKFLPGLQLGFETRPAAPDRLVALPTGRGLVYNILWRRTLLKTGKAGPNSKERLSHHFNGCANSNLRDSLRADPDYLAIISCPPDVPRDWMQRNLDVFLIFAGDQRKRLEDHLFEVLPPRYEGGFIYEADSQTRRKA